MTIEIQTHHNKEHVTIVYYINIYLQQSETVYLFPTTARPTV